MHRTYLLLGSNIGDRIRWLAFARREIASRIGTLHRISSVYQSAAWGLTDQASFLNQALAVDTSLDPERLLKETALIEDIAGRQRSVHWGARTLDIDVLFYDALTVQTKRLTIPHPEFQNRNFAMLTLLEIAPDLVHPVSGLRIRDLVNLSLDQSEVSILPD